MRFHLVSATFMGMLTFASAGLITQLPDGLPNPTKEQLKTIEQRAHGLLPNGPGPMNISQKAIISLKAIAFNELTEVALFSQLLSNVTNNVTGFEVPECKRDYIIKTLTTIVGQEEMHAIAANAALKAANVPPIKPCTYHFPVTNYQDGIAFVYKFTDLVLGVLQDAIVFFNKGGDPKLARLIASIIGQEGEQAGWYRAVLHKVPSELPFLTFAEPSYAASLIVQYYAIPGSCPNVGEIPLPIFQPMKVLTQPAAKTMLIKVALESNGTMPNPMWLTYINQQNLPIVQPLKVLSQEDGKTIAQALFPYEEHMMNGLSIALVTNSGGPFSSASAAGDAAVFGPGLIEVH